MARLRISVELDETAFAALEAAARNDDISLGQAFRDAVDRDLRRRARAKRAVRADERLVAPLRSLLADDLAWAKIGTNCKTA